MAKLINLEFCIGPEPGRLRLALSEWAGFASENQIRLRAYYEDGYTLLLDIPTDYKSKRKPLPKRQGGQISFDFEVGKPAALPIP